VAVKFNKTHFPYPARRVKHGKTPSYALRLNDVKLKHIVYGWGFWEIDNGRIKIVK